MAQETNNRLPISIANNTQLTKSSSFGTNLASTKFGNNVFTTYTAGAPNDGVTGIGTNITPEITNINATYGCCLLGANIKPHVSYSTHDIAIGANIDPLVTGSGQGVITIGCNNALNHISSDASALSCIGCNIANNTSADAPGTAVGDSSLSSATCYGNICFGKNALTELNTLGTKSLDGILAFYNANSDTYNWERIHYISPDSAGNVAFGAYSGAGLTDGNSNLFIGSNVGTTLADNCFGVVIGDGSKATARRQTVIGYTGAPLAANTSQNACYIDGIRGHTIDQFSIYYPVVVDLNGQLGTTSSSLRYKENVSALSSEFCNKVLQLEPVQFNYKTHQPTDINYGLIAEEVEKVLPELVAYGIDKQIETVYYQYLPILMLKEIQDQQVIIDELKLKLSKKV